MELVFEGGKAASGGGINDDKEWEYRKWLTNKQQLLLLKKPVH